MENSYVYILTNQYNTTLYLGATSNLVKRIYEHREKLADGFSKRYNLNKLVYFEMFGDITNAIAREKQLKAGSRMDKLDLIKNSNPQWNYLHEEITK